MGLCTAGRNKSPGLSISCLLTLDPGIPWGHPGSVGAELCATALQRWQVYKESGHTERLQSHDPSLFLHPWVNSYDSNSGSCMSVDDTPLESSDCFIGQDWPYDPGLGCHNDHSSTIMLQGFSPVERPLQYGVFISTVGEAYTCCLHTYTFMTCLATHGPQLHLQRGKSMTAPASSNVLVLWVSSSNVLWVSSSVSARFCSTHLHRMGTTVEGISERADGQTA